MKKFFISFLCTILCATWHNATAQENETVNFTTFPLGLTAVDGNEWTSELMTFEQPVSGFRITILETDYNVIYNGVPCVALAEIDITDTNGNDIAYTATTNSLQQNDGGGLAALNDNDNSTYYHSAWNSFNSYGPDGFVYIELTFDEPQTAFTYKQVARNSGHFPIRLCLTDLGTTPELLEAFNLTKEVDEETATMYLNAKDGEADIPVNIKGITDITGIEHIVLGDNITSIGNDAFNGCTELKSVTIPNSVTSIGSYAFQGCVGLTGITIPESVTTIEDYLFDKCSSFKTIAIPNSVTSIGKGAFQDCSGLISISIGNKVKVIGQDAFMNCPNLASITIPNSVTTIKQAAFYGCSSLTSVTIPESVTTVGPSAFYNCYALREVHISDIAAWCNVDFMSGVHGQPNPLYNADNLYLNGELVTELVIPEGIKTIKENVFPKCNFVVKIEEPTPPAISSNSFAGLHALVVPDEAYEAYCNASVWSDYKSLMTVESAYTKDIEVSHESSFSSVLSAIGEENTTKVVNLTIKGSINSYDVIVLRDKMPLLRQLDLSQATVAASSKAFYEGNCTAENDLGSRAFYNLSNLISVKLPMGLVKISDNLFDGCGKLTTVEIPSTVQSVGNSAFSNCSSLMEISLPETMTSIGSSAFYRCSKLKSIVIPKGIITLPSNYDGLFKNCRNLESVTLPDGLETIGKYTFEDCSKLKNIKLPTTLTTIEGYAFRNCSSLEEIRIPSSVTSISNYAFSNCNNLNKVYTYTVEPTSISENTFSTFTTATLYVPKVSYWNYYWDDGWKRFLNLADFDEPYEYFYVNNDYTLDDETGYIEGADGKDPDADINAGGGLIVEGEQTDEEDPNQNLGDVNINHDGEGNSGSIIADNNLHIDNLNIRINVKGGRWYFFAFPFDIPFEKISMENGSSYVFRYYDGDERAKGKSGWKDINENHLKAARGYIFQCSANDVLILSIEDIRFKKEDKYNELIAHISENLKDASWNFMGNPYLSYYDMADMDYTAPVTVWDGSKYVAMRPGDDDYHFGPYEAFFVQKPEGKDDVEFKGDDKMTGKQSKEKKEKQAAARRARGIDPERLLVNIALSNGTASDRTRVVFNERQASGYETACDAAKFSTAGVPQLYTIDSDGVRYAINERPADNGIVKVGYTAPQGGFYTIEMQRMDVPVFIKDNKTGTLHNFEEGAYNFSSDAGTFEGRFEIMLAKGTTAVEDVEAENGDVKTVYDLQGRKVKAAGNGIYIINGEKQIVK